MSKKVDKRRLEIVRLIKSEGEVNVADTARMFGVTMETIRADFDFLAEENGFLRMHGGLKEKDNTKYNRNYFFDERKVIHMEDKKRLCYRAMELIRDGDCIYVDSGSTVTYLLNYLHMKKNLTIVTHSVAFLIEYTLNSYKQMFQEQGHRFLFTGGEVEGNILMTYGAFFEQTATNLIYDHLLYSVDALDADFGCTNVDYEAYATVKSILRTSKNKILLADNSKFDLRATYKVSTLDQIDYLITNAPMKENWKVILEHNLVKYFEV